MSSTCQVGLPGFRKSDGRPELAYFGRESPRVIPEPTTASARKLDVHYPAELYVPSTRPYRGLEDLDYPPTEPVPSPMRACRPRCRSPMTPARRAFLQDRH